ncbi:hypothetical protein N0V82_002145 [Gnomoniopsis sp. IMI 355080]|nr:hypothetical protein N0V82_002145 [Gnomoniopsis sp. IMI 355080]
MMADSGDNVDENAQEFDNHKDGKADKENNQGEMEPVGIHNDNAHLDPSRYWFASSAFPMIAATLGPVASAFSVCALVKPWRQNFPPGSDIDKAVFIDDPIWLTVVNAIQLAMALVANVLFLLNLARKVRFTIAQPATIVTWYISSFCLIALTSTAAGPLIVQPTSQYIWSGSFYYGIYAAVLYFFCSSLMVVTFWGAMKGYYPKDFQLTTSQRTLMLQTIMFLVYLLLGALVFSRIEAWDFLDAVYWADVTLFTVGFGDYSAATPLGRALLFPYALIGIISLGLVVGSIRSLVLERARRQLGARMTEKTRKRMLRRMAKRGKDDILIPVADNDGDDLEAPTRTPTGLTELARRQKEFELMRKIQASAERRRRWMAMSISTTVWLCLWLVGAAIFQQCEVTYQGWTYFDGFYFAFVSLTTIGYGDVTPISPAGKSFFVFWSLLALPTMTVLVSNAGDTVVKLVREWTDWLGTVTILPGERGVRKELKIFLHYLSLGKVFSEDDIKESPPGFLGNANRRDTSNGSEEDEEKAIADETGRRRPKPTDRLEAEVRSIIGDERVDRREGEKVPAGSDKTSDTTYTGMSSMSEKGDSHNHDHEVHRTLPGHNANNNSISFAEPGDRPPSSRKTGNSLNLQRASSKGSSKSSKSHPNDHGQQRGDVNSQTLPMGRTVSVARTDLPVSIPKNRHDLAVVLIDEISRVTQHLKTHPPRKYSFEEWAWFLRLIGEDESRADTHKKPVPKSRKKKHDGTVEGDEGHEEKDDPDKLQWSWVGSRSPLMGSQEEAEWILDRLEHRLAELLRSMRAEANWKKMGSRLGSKS